MITAKASCLAVRLLQANPSSTRFHSLLKNISFMEHKKGRKRVERKLLVVRCYNVLMIPSVIRSIATKYIQINYDVLKKSRFSEVFFLLNIVLLFEHCFLKVWKVNEEKLASKV